MSRDARLVERREAQRPRDGLRNPVASGRARPTVGFRTPVRDGARMNLRKVHRMGSRKPLAPPGAPFRAMEKGKGAAPSSWRPMARDWIVGRISASRPSW
jgi:hypothetical protein